MNDNNNYDIDLGSDAEEFDPFAREYELDEGVDESTEDTPAPQPIATKQTKTVAIIAFPFNIDTFFTIIEPKFSISPTTSPTKKC